MEIICHEGEQMTKIDKGDIVQSQNGRDKGKALFVLDVQDEYLLLIDGKSRKIEHPKRKKAKHCMFLKTAQCRVADKIRQGEKFHNIDVRRELAIYRDDKSSEEDLPCQKTI